MFAYKQVSIPAINDSKLIGISVYIVFILSATGLGLSFVIDDDPGLLFLIISTVELLSTSIPLGVIFFPKVLIEINLRWDKYAKGGYTHTE